MFENFCYHFGCFRINLVKSAVFLALVEIAGRIFFVYQDFHRDFKYAILYYHAEILLQFLYVLMSINIPLQLIYASLKVSNFLYYKKRRK